MSITVTVPAGSELYDNELNEFYVIPSDIHITMEHSLISLQLWEQKWHIPFLDKRISRTNEQLVDYLRCMSLTKNVDPKAFYMLPASEIKRIKLYIEDPMTATTIAKDSNRRAPTEIKTAEVIYSDMILLGIPFECRKWHLNSLLMLINVCAEKQKPEKKMSRNDIYAQNRALNRARRKAMHSKG